MDHFPQIKPALFYTSFQRTKKIEREEKKAFVCCTNKQKRRLSKRGSKLKRKKGGRGQTRDLSTAV